MYSRSNYQTSIWWAEVSIKIVSSIHVLPDAVAGFERTHDLGQMRRFRVHFTGLLLLFWWFSTVHGISTSQLNFVFCKSWTGFHEYFTTTLAYSFESAFLIERATQRFLCAYVCHDFTRFFKLFDYCFFKVFDAKIKFRLRLTKLLTNAPRGRLFTIYAWFDQ